MEKGDPEAPGSDTTVVESTFCGYVNVNVFLYSQLGAGKLKLELIAFHPQKVLIIGSTYLIHSFTFHVKHSIH